MTDAVRMRNDSVKAKRSPLSPNFYDYISNRILEITTGFRKKTASEAYARKHISRGSLANMNRSIYIATNDFDRNKQIKMRSDVNDTAGSC